MQLLLFPRYLEQHIEYHRYRKYNVFAFEAVQAQEYMGYQLEKRAIEQDVPLRVEQVRPQTDKIARIQNLQPLIKQGTIQLSRRHINLLEEMKYFPKGRFDDGLDALEMVYELSKTITGGGSSFPTSFQRNSEAISDVLKDIPDLRGHSIPSVHNKEGGDRFVPPSKNGPTFLIF